MLVGQLPDAVYVAADVTDPGGAAAPVGAAIERSRRFDVVVNDTGTAARVPHHDLQAVATARYVTGDIVLVDGGLHRQ